MFLLGVVRVVFSNPVELKLNPWLCLRFFARGFRGFRRCFSWCGVGGVFEPSGIETKFVALFAVFCSGISGISQMFLLGVVRVVFSNPVELKLNLWLCFFFLHGDFGDFADVFLGAVRVVFSQFCVASRYAIPQPASG